MILVHGSPTLNTLYWTEDRPESFNLKMARNAGAKAGDGSVDTNREYPRMHRFRSAIPTLFLTLLLLGCGADSAMELDPEAAQDGQIPPPSDVEGPPSHAESSESGLAWVVLERGDGETFPTPSDMVRVHYTGWQTDGTMFDSSVMRGGPAEFPAGNLIQGWVEGLQLMSEGEIRRFWIPAELAYGDPPERPGAPGGMLVFDVQLIEVLGG
ncbi:MAG: FKBP-type peptidyl-prolyl cis-trans isomerase, partial [Gemmatimonadota bacterium]